jgi:hypothetical protein
MSIFERFFDAPVFDFEKEKQKFIKNMDYLKSMPVEEQTLHKKWVEVQDMAKYADRSSVVKAKIWRPRDITNKQSTVEDLQNLQPIVRYVDPTDERKMLDWLMLRTFISTMTFDQNPGRFLRFLVSDEVSGKYLGVVSIASDVISIQCRDKWIGWTAEDKTQAGMLRHSAIGSTIVPTQPFGFNFLGGKLVASAILTTEVKDTWKRLYNDTLVGMTTTSLYGSESMYNSIPFWKKLGSSKGKIALKPDPEFYETWHDYIKEHFKEEYDSKMEQKEGVGGPVTGAKQRALNMIFRAVGVKASNYTHGFERGVYYAPLYENSREFFRREITEEELIPLKKLEREMDAVLDWWRPKAIARYERLHDEGRVNKNIHFYNDLIGVSWEDARKKYLKDVGR